MQLNKTLPTTDTLILIFFIPITNKLLIVTKTKGEN